MSFLLSLSGTRERRVYLCEDQVKEKKLNVKTPLKALDLRVRELKMCRWSLEGRVMMGGEG